MEPPQVNHAGTRLIQDQTGVLREVGSVSLGANRKLVLQDTAGKAIQPLLATAFKAPLMKVGTGNITPIMVQKFIVSGIPVFIDPAGNIIDVEQGQADDSVLVAQNGSLVYYVSMVNDVYAYFLTGMKDGKLSPAATHFPTTQGDLNAITTFASAHGKTFPDPTALTVEVKSSWVEAAGLANLSSYITTQATIPTYNKNQSQPLGAERAEDRPSWLWWGCTWWEARRSIRRWCGLPSSISATLPTALIPIQTPRTRRFRYPRARRERGCSRLRTVLVPSTRSGR